MSKGKKLLYVLNRNKPFFALFSLILSFVIVVGSTYAWYTDDDQRINRANTSHHMLAAIINENYEMNLKWAPGTTTKKEIKVTNIGQRPAFIRMALHEFFLGFEVKVESDTDGVGDGNLKVYPNLTTPVEVNQEDVSTWQVGNAYQIGDNKAYKANLAVINPIEDHSKAYQYDGTRPAPLGFFELQFNPKVFDAKNPPSQNESAYWYYEKGYFYYSELLKPEDHTEKLLEGIKLSAEYGNTYKGALYKLVPLMEACEINSSVFSEWNISNTDYVYTMYRELLD